MLKVMALKQGHIQGIEITWSKYNILHQLSVILIFFFNKGCLKMNVTVKFFAKPQKAGRGCFMAVFRQANAFQRV